jgi:hypothetical protein
VLAQLQCTPPVHVLWLSLSPRPPPAAPTALSHTLVQPSFLEMMQLGVLFHYRKKHTMCHIQVFMAARQTLCSFSRPRALWSVAHYYNWTSRGIYYDLREHSSLLVSCPARLDRIPARLRKPWDPRVDRRAVRQRITRDGASTWSGAWNSRF